MLKDHKKWHIVSFGTILFWDRFNDLCSVVTDSFSQEFSIAIVTIFVNQTMDSKDSTDSMVETSAFN